MGSHKCYVKTALSVHTFHFEGGTSDHSQDTVGFGHLFKNVSTPFEVGCKRHSEVFLGGNVF